MELRNDFSDVFVAELDRAAILKCEEARIVLEGTDSCYVGPRPIKREYLDEVRKEIKSMVNKGVIQESRSWHNAPLMIVMKKDGRLRVCLDFRELNRRTRTEKWALPRTYYFEKYGGNALVFEVGCSSRVLADPCVGCRSGEDCICFRG